MGFFKRLAQIAHSQINDLLDRLEDPKKMADQAALDLKEGKIKAEAMAIKAKGRVRLLEQKLLKLKDDANLLLKEAESLLKNADEEGARLVLRRKQAITMERLSIEQELSQEQKVIETISTGLKVIDNKIGELELSSKTIAKDIIDKEDAFSTFARMEEKIEQEEAQWKALDELLDLEPSAKQEMVAFDKHSDPEALEKELLALKNKLDEGR